MLTDKLSSKLNKAIALTRGLDKSLALEYLWPDAFKYGRARAHWFGPANSDHFRPSVPVHLKHEFKITDGEGNTRMFGYEEVPEILGGGLKKEEYVRVTNLTKD